jgi:hypothetical protein
MKTLVWIKQPEKSRICGQIAVAVITGISVEESKKLIGKNFGTNTKDIAKALRKMGYKCPNRCKRLKEKPKLAIAQVRKPSKKSGWHWVVIHEDKIYDGIDGNPDGTVNWIKGQRITSYLPIII